MPVIFARQFLFIFYLSIIDKGHKATNMPLNITAHKHYRMKTKINTCIIKTQDLAKHWRC